VLCRRLASADTQITDIAFKNVNGRVASQLLALADQYGREIDGEKVIDLKLTHQDIAEMVGTNRESISRAMSAFRREGSIAIRARKIVILDEKALAGWM
ncbi:MAG TPA: Crp/Fnr family transcriptional regulator, partial [Planctomycetaceae bacterium]|nr:Crp/Fnr family transcriptional regulator [Planctomycetaceae bacterium]